MTRGAGARPHRGVHRTLDAPLPFPVVDACVQIFDDAGYTVTTWWPRAPLEDAMIRALVARGYDDAAVAGILGGNLLRLQERVFGA